jgi:hypothetical protein
LAPKAMTTVRVLSPSGTASESVFVACRSFWGGAAFV